MRTLSDLFGPLARRIRGQGEAVTSVAIVFKPLEFQTQREIVALKLGEYLDSISYSPIAYALQGSSFFCVTDLIGATARASLCAPFSATSGKPLRVTCSWAMTAREHCKWVAANSRSCW